MSRLLNHFGTFANLYDRLPPTVQNLGLSLAGLYVKAVRYNAGYDRLFREAVARDAWSAEQTMAYRDECIGRFVRHAAATVPHYRDQFRTLRLDPRDINGFDDLCALPVLSKATVLESPERFVSEAVPARLRIASHTSGTTGAALHFVTTMDAFRRQWAIWWRYRAWHGIRQGTPVAIFRALPLVPVSQQTPPFWRFNSASKELYLSAQHLAPQYMTDFIDALNRRRIPWMHGFPSCITAFADFLVDRRRSLDYPLRWVTTGSENLTERQALTIEKAFGVRPINRYGLNEAVANISEQTDGGLYVDEDFAAVEFVDGRIIGTNLSNPAFPLIRYETGDAATADGTADFRGRRRVATLDGRSDDYVIRCDGARLGRLDRIFHDSVKVLEAQIYQERVGAVTFKLVRRPGYTPDDERALISAARAHFGDDMQIAVDYVERIERAPSGKPRLVVAAPGLR
jgi:phenylacetate-CoA ligase